MKSLSDNIGAVQQINIIRHQLVDDGIYPNNGLLPLMVYRKAFHISGPEQGDVVKALFESNSWTNAWEDGIYDYHHYHSTAHEVLCIIKGTSRIQFGGPSGISLQVEVGDVVIIPAGVAHKNLGDNDDFLCIGAYPEGQNYDMNYGKAGERPGTDENISKVPIPDADPVYGIGGPLIKNWVTEPDSIPEVL